MLAVEERKLVRSGGSKGSRKNIIRECDERIALLLGEKIWNIPMSVDIISQGSQLRMGNGAGEG